MLKIQVLGKGLIPRGLGLAPKKTPFPADLTLIRVIISTPGLRVNFVNPNTKALQELNRDNLQRMWDLYNSNTGEYRNNETPLQKPIVPPNPPVSNPPVKPVVPQTPTEPVKPVVPPVNPTPPVVEVKPPVVTPPVVVQPATPPAEPVKTADPVKPVENNNTGVLKPVTNPNEKDSKPAEDTSKK